MYCPFLVFIGDTSFIPIEPLSVSECLSNVWMYEKNKCFIVSSAQEVEMVVDICTSSTDGC